MFIQNRDSNKLGTLLDNDVALDQDNQINYNLLHIPKSKSNIEESEDFTGFYDKLDSHSAERQSSTYAAKKMVGSRSVNGLLEDSTAVDTQDFTPKSNQAISDKLSININNNK